MRWIAVARYRLLTSVRASVWLFALAIVAAGLPVALAGATTVGAFSPLRA